MFADQMRLSDGVTLKLECAHIMTGGEMKCLRCGEIIQHIVEPKVEAGEVQFGDNASIQLS